MDTVNIGEELTELSEKSFAGCSSLANIGLSDGLVKIGDNCFENCKSITTISIPSTVETVGKSVFSGCEKLSNLIVEEREEGLNGFDETWKDGLSSQVVISVGFNIALNYNNATSSGANSVSVIQGENYELPVPSRNGYKFLGWYDSLTNGSRLTDENGVSVGGYDKYESITVFALWEANVNKIVFDPMEIKNVEFTKEQLYDMGYYQDVIDCVCGYYDTLGAAAAFTDISKEGKLVLYLEDYYQNVIYMYKSRKT